MKEENDADNLPGCSERNHPKSASNGKIRRRNVNIQQ